MLSCHIIAYFCKLIVDYKTKKAGVYTAHESYYGYRFMKRLLLELFPCFATFSHGKVTVPYPTQLFFTSDQRMIGSIKST